MSSYISIGSYNIVSVDGFPMQFIIPKSVRLLSSYLNAGQMDDDDPDRRWSWWVDDGAFHYYDDNGDEKVIEAIPSYITITSSQEEEKHECEEENCEECCRGEFCNCGDNKCPYCSAKMNR